MIKLIIILLLLLIIPSDKVINWIGNTKPNDILTPSIYTLLGKAIKTNTLEYNNINEFDTPEKFLFFRSGTFLGQSVKKAIAINCLSDTTFSIKLFSMIGQTWQLLDSITGLEAFPWQFDLQTKDYNFDGQQDVYIQVSASNGWSLSRGHLILINPNLNKFELHPEARDLANMSVDGYSGTIFSEEWNGYDSLWHPQLIISANRWIGGKLKTIEKRDTTLLK